jgi:hypothetical protein
MAKTVTSILPHKLASLGLKVVLVQTLERRTAPKLGATMALE